MKTLSLYDLEMNKLNVKTSFSEQIAILPELKKADEVLRGFDWNKINNQETIDAIFLMELSRMGDKDSFANYCFVARENSKGLEELIDILNGKDINAKDCFHWIIENYQELITELEKMPTSKKDVGIRKITEDWQVSMFQ